GRRPPCLGDLLAYHVREGAVTRQLAMRTLVVTAALTLASLIGWWALPTAAAAFGAMTPRDRGGPVVAGLAATLGGVLQIRPVGVYGLTLAFPGLLAVCAALVGRAAMRLAKRTDAPPAASPPAPAS